MVNEVRAQPYIRYNAFSYNVNEGLLQSTVTDLTVDKNNFCWISFPNGIQRFDGLHFKNILIQPGLPDDKHCRFFRTGKNELIISHSLGFSRYDAAQNRFYLLFTYPDGKKTPAVVIGEDDGHLYFFSSTAEIISMRLDNYKIEKIVKTGLGKIDETNYILPKIGKNIINHKFSFIINSIIYQWDLKSNRVIQKSLPFPNISNYFLKQINEDEVLYYNYDIQKTTINYYNYKTGQSGPYNKDFYINGIAARLNYYQWNNLTLLSINNRVYQTEKSKLKIIAELVNFQNQSFAAENTITKIQEDNFGNLYLQTVTGGLRKIIRNNFPIKFYNNGDKDRNFSLAVLPDKENNRILMGARGSGVLVFDTLQQLTHQIKFTTETDKTGTVNLILKKPGGGYLAFVNGEKKVREISSRLIEFNSVPIHSNLPENIRGIGYFSKVLMQNDKEALVQTENKIYHINFQPLTVSEHSVTTGYTMSGLYYSPYIITHSQDELIYLNATNFSTEKKIPFKNTGYVRCFTADKDRRIYIGSNNGIFVTDSLGNILHHYSKQTGLPDDCIYAMEFDAAGNLWCSTNKGIIKLKDGKLLHQLKKEDGIQENEFNTNVSYRASDGELFFGGVNGVSSFYPSTITETNANVRLLFTSITANNEDAIKDTAAWEIDKITLPYNHNTISFDFIAMGGYNPDQYLYQYKMKGIDNEWIPTHSLQTVRYSLQPGKYTFQLYASRSFEKDAIPLKELKIIIRPPFWKTWWFLSGIGLLLFSSLAYIINQKNKRKFEKKLQQLENERQLKEERERISRDLHDSLGVYANAVLYNAELLEKEKTSEKGETIISDLKFASKDIITSLRETVWALKKDSYSAEDCLVRIRNFIQPLTRYYNHIQFTIEGDAPGDTYYHYTKALNIVRIVQEAIANAIKHSGSTEIQVHSTITDNNKWKLSVADNGNGFNYEEKSETSTGNGLTNMKQRAAVSELQIAFESEQNNGTTITLII